MNISLIKTILSSKYSEEEINTMTLKELEKEYHIIVNEKIIKNSEIQIKLAEQELLKIKNSDYIPDPIDPEK